MYIEGKIEMQEEMLRRRIGWTDTSHSNESRKVEAPIKALPPTPVVPEQSIAPVRVEVRDGVIDRVSDANGALDTPEIDFERWRAPVAALLIELLTRDFKQGQTIAAYVKGLLP